MWQVFCLFIVPYLQQVKKIKIAGRYLMTALIGIYLLSVSIRLSAQNSASSIHFIDYQRSIPKISDLLNRKEDTLIKQFKEKNLVWPARFVYIRSFKYDSQLEVWV